MQKILNEVPFDRKGNFTTDDHYTFSLKEAIALYNKSRREALEQLYKSKEITQSKSMEMEADFEEVAASCGYFSFSLQDFANELITYLEILDDLKLEVEERPDGRTWAWLRFWRPVPESKPPGADFGQISATDPETNNVHGNLPGVSKTKTSDKYGQYLSNKSRIEQYRYRLWRALGFFRRDDIKFAVKVGVGAALYALPSFLSSTRPFYQRWRGEWGLLSYILVCTMTLGASNTTGWSRFIGTVIGAVCAIVSWEIADRNVFLLAFFGWVMCLWCSYIVIGKGQGPFGRFIVLTYNLSALYAYSVAVHDAPGDPDEGGIDPVITEITLHRTAAVISGCIWGLIITRMIFPISDSTKFKDGLSLLWLRMGLIWKRDPLNIPFEPQAYMDLREEFELHRFLTRLESLRGSAKSELHLRGPFPEAAYGKILKSTGAMLDAFHALNVMILKNSEASKGEAALHKYTEEERTAVCTRISHLFQVLASSMKIEFPMNGALPGVSHTRDRLLAKMFRFRREEKEKIGATDEDFESLYAFSLVTGQLSEEIKGMGKEIEKLFGVFDEDLLKLQ
ncbi:uncharacterized protein KY384_002438 [Bacidia gigantensis]|uniref:uncharacterized protein n=1 Tax=Bacidia gigantensis TaxID=2732470 RepID=UPI001D03D428|nr:uncharacterized protein KY384_002438 [Bacidia gigantensis]KAG8532561.1 hypothetical protein KY384_002438 [Bacidia gigantensis]